MYVILYFLLAAEFVARLLLEIRECRITQTCNKIFAILRLIPLVNDIVPLPESKNILTKTEFETAHEIGHKKLHHALLRNLVKIVFLLLAVWFFAFLIASSKLDLLHAILWLHLFAIPCKIIFHIYCWNQELEADKFALKKLGKKETKKAMCELIKNEISYTNLFALIYREHPTATLRNHRLL